MPGDGSGGDRYELVEIYEAFSAEYGFAPRDIEARFTDEQFAVYAEKFAKRRKAQAFAELDRIVIGNNWAHAIANDFDRKGHYQGRTARKWESVRTRATGEKPKSLSGAALEQTVMALAATDPSLVKIQGAT